MGLTFNLGRVSPSVFTDSSLNIGIGAAPSGTYKLEVTGTAKVSSTLLLGGALSGTSASFSGNVGIGKASSSFALDTLLTDASTNTILGVAQIGRASSGTAANGIGGNLQFTAQDTAGTQRTAAYITWKLAAASSASPQGYLSIGSRNASEALIIADTGAATFSSSVTAGGTLEATTIQSFNSSPLYLFSTPTGANYEVLALDKSATDARIRVYKSGTGSYRDLTFETGGSERMRITSGGNVVIGTSSDAGITLVPASGTSKYQTAGDGGSGSIWHASIETTWANYENYGCSQMTFKTELKASGTSDTSVTQMVIRPTGDIRMTSLVGTGSRTVTADANGTLSASSDSSLKQEDTSHKIEGLAEILQLKPRAYKWLSDIEIRGENAATEIGFFANEVNPIIPSAAPKGNYDLYGFYDRAVIAALVKAIQELSAQNQDLKSRLDKAGL